MYILDNKRHVQVSTKADSVSASSLAFMRLLGAFFSPQIFPHVKVVGISPTIVQWVMVVVLRQYPLRFHARPNTDAQDRRINEAIRQYKASCER